MKDGTDELIVLSLLKTVWHGMLGWYRINWKGLKGNCHGLIMVLSILIMVLSILIMVLFILIMVLSILSELKLIPLGRIWKLWSPSYSRYFLSFMESKGSWPCLVEMSNVIMALESFCKFTSLENVHLCSLWSSIFHIVIFQEVFLPQFCMHFSIAPSDPDVCFESMRWTV